MNFILIGMVQMVQMVGLVKLYDQELLTFPSDQTPGPTCPTHRHRAPAFV